MSFNCSAVGIPNSLIIIANKCLYVNQEIINFLISSDFIPYVFGVYSNNGTRSACVRSFLSRDKSPPPNANKADNAVLVVPACRLCIVCHI